MDADIKAAINWFKSYGCDVLPPKHKNSNGPDLTIIKNNEAFRIEIKQLYKTQSGSWQVPPVTSARQTDDFILIMRKTDIILFMSMQDHLKLCSPQGVRILSFEMKVLK